MPLHVSGSLGVDESAVEGAGSRQSDLRDACILSARVLGDEISNGIGTIINFHALRRLFAAKTDPKNVTDKLNNIRISQEHHTTYL